LPSHSGGILICGLWSWLRWRDLRLKAAGLGTDVEEDSPGTPNPPQGAAGENSTD